MVFFSPHLPLESLKCIFPLVFDCLSEMKTAYFHRIPTESPMLATSGASADLDIQICN